MFEIAEFVCLEARLLLGGFVAVVLYQMLVGKINTRGLLFSKETGTFDPARLQLMLFTLYGAFSYLVKAMEEPGLPAPDATLIALVGGSNVLYLGNKGFSVYSLLKKLKSS